MLHPDAYTTVLSAAQRTRLSQADPDLLPAAERAATAEVLAALAGRYDVAPLQADPTGASWPLLVRQAVVELVLVQVIQRQHPTSADAGARATRTRQWLAQAAAGQADPGLPPRPSVDPHTGTTAPAALLGGSHPRLALDRAE